MAQSCFFLGDKPSGKVGGGASQVAQWQRILLPMQEMRVQSLGGEGGHLEEEMAIHSSICAPVCAPTPPCYAPTTTHPGVHIWLQVELQWQRGKREPRPSPS